MKKLLFLIGAIFMLMASIAPPVMGTDKDVGYQFKLPADNSFVSIECQAVVFSPEYAIPVQLRDYGDRCVELRVQSPGLRAESRAINCTFYQGDLIINRDFYFDQHGSRIYLMNKRVPICRITSTSNGGAGY